MDCNHNIFFRITHRKRDHDVLLYALYTSVLGIFIGFVIIYCPSNSHLSVIPIIGYGNIVEANLFMICSVQHCFFVTIKYVFDYGY